jgi:hypothetical protein
VAEAVAVAIEACRPQPARTHRRVAWVTADAPDAESAEALAALAREFDVELVLPTDSVTAGLAARFRVLAADEVADRHEAAPFDVFAAVASPRGFHPDVGSVARRHRGLVVLPPLDEPGDPAGELAQAVVRAAGVVVSSARDRRWVRALTDGPVLTQIGPWTAAVLAAGLRTAAARLDADDARWTDAAANALAVLPGPPPPTVVDDWVALRHEHTRRPAATT